MPTPKLDNHLRSLEREGTLIDALSALRAAQKTPSRFEEVRAAIGSWIERRIDSCMRLSDETTADTATTMQFLQQGGRWIEIHAAFMDPQRVACIPDDMSDPDLGGVRIPRCASENTEDFYYDVP